MRPPPPDRMAHDEPAADEPPRRLPLWATAADVATVGLLLLAAAIAIAGGFVAHPGGLRLSLRSEWRPLMWAGVLFAVRHIVVRRPALHERLIAGARGAALAQGPLPEDDGSYTTRVSIDGRPTSAAERALAALGVVALYAALTLAMTYPQVRVLDRGVSPDIADPLLSTWRLSWVAHQLPRDPAHLFDANIFFPARGTLAFSDAMLVPALTAAPLVWMGVHPLLVYNLLLLSGFALSGAAMFLLVRSLTGHTGAALVGGFIFAFLPYRFMHYAHLELQMTQWMPLALWALHRTVRDGRLRDGLLTGTFIAIQTLSSFYYGIFFATYLVPVGAALLLGRQVPVWRAARALAAGAVLAAILVAPFVRPYFAARRSVGERPLSEVEFYSATPRNYLAAHPRNAMFGTLTAGWGGQERELFQGIAVPLVAAAGLWPPISAARMGYAVGLAVAFELSLGTNGVAYTWIRAHALPYRGLRVPARMAILVGLSLAILAGYGVARLARRWPGRWGTVAVVAGVMAIVVAEYRSTLVLKDVWRAPSPVYAMLADEPGAVLLEVPLIAPDVALEPIYMYFSTFHWHRLVNGYSGFSPPSYHDLLRTMETFPDDASVAEIRRRGVDYVIVHGAFYTPPEFRALAARLDARADLVLAGVTRWELRESRVYRVTK